MKAAIFRGPGVVEVGDRPDPVIEAPTDAIVRVLLGSVCGSDLWYYRGESSHAVGSIGHEFIGVVAEIGTDVTTVAPGDLVVAPFIYAAEAANAPARPGHGHPPRLPARQARERVASHGRSGPMG